MKKTFEDISAEPICQRVRILRKKLGFNSALAFSKQISVKYTTYINFEKNRMPPPEFFFVLKKKYPHNVDVNWLLTGEEPKRPGQVAEDQIEYGGMADLISKATEILKSNTTYREALASNINAFYQALKQEEEIGKLEKESRKNKTDNLPKAATANEGT